MRLGSEILILSLFLVDLGTLKAHSIACANRYRRRGLGLFAASRESDSVFITSVCYRHLILLLEIYWRLSLHGETCENI